MITIIVEQRSLSGTFFTAPNSKNTSKPYEFLDLCLVRAIVLDPVLFRVEFKALVRC